MKWQQSTEWSDWETVFHEMGSDELKWRGRERILLERRILGNPHTHIRLYILIDAHIFNSIRCTWVMFIICWHLMLSKFIRASVNLSFLWTFEFCLSLNSLKAHLGSNTCAASLGSAPFAVWLTCFWAQHDGDPTRDLIFCRSMTLNF